MHEPEGAPMRLPVDEIVLRPLPSEVPEVVRLSG
jgi:hypothetical protein